MSGDFFQELEDFLSNEWILIADACAIFAGFIPISPYIADWSYEDSSREYLDLDGKRTSPNYKEIQRIQKKWKGSDWQVPYRNEVFFDRDPLKRQTVGRHNPRSEITPLLTIKVRDIRLETFQPVN